MLARKRAANCVSPANSSTQASCAQLLVEQNLALAMRAAGRFYILRAGEIVKSGDIGELKQNHRQLAHTYYL